jgi:hypothetical protein
MNRLIRIVSTAAVLAISSSPLAAQWPRQATPAVPRTPTGEPDFRAAAPRTPEGKPDLSGVWRSGGDFRHAQGPNAPPTPQPWDLASATSMWVAVGLPFTDYGEQLAKTRQAAFSKDNPRSHCLPMGFMQLHVVGGPATYLQTPRELVILYEVNGERREIFTDGRALPANDPQPWWNGYSVGRWDGDTLVVETTHFRDGGWLDMSGSPLTDSAKVVERYRRPSYGWMEIDITVDDPKAYRKPWSVRVNQRLLLDQDLIEHVCLENNQFPREGKNSRR